MGKAFDIVFRIFSALLGLILVLAAGSQVLASRLGSRH